MSGLVRVGEDWISVGGLESRVGVCVRGCAWRVAIAGGREIDKAYIYKDMKIHSGQETKGCPTCAAHRPVIARCF